MDSELYLNGSDKSWNICLKTWTELLYAYSVNVSNKSDAKYATSSHPGIALRNSLQTSVTFLPSSFNTWIATRPADLEWTFLRIKKKRMLVNTSHVLHLLRGTNFRWKQFNPRRNLHSINELDWTVGKILDDCRTTTCVFKLFFVP